MNAPLVTQMNLWLIKEPMAVFDHVVVHLLAHLLEAKHTLDF